MHGKAAGIDAPATARPGEPTGHHVWRRLPARNRTAQPRTPALKARSGMLIGQPYDGGLVVSYRQCRLTGTVARSGAGIQPMATWRGPPTIRFAEATDTPRHIITNHSEPCAWVILPCCRGGSASRCGEKCHRLMLSRKGGASQMFGRCCFPKSAAAWLRSGAGSEFRPITAGRPERGPPQVAPSLCCRHLVAGAPSAKPWTSIG